MNIPTPRRENGFTVIELVVILVIICLLAGLILFSYSDVRSRDRDALRQQHIDELQSHLEVYYAQESKYPTLTQLNDDTWRTKNTPDLASESLRDPSWKADGSCTTQGSPTLLTKVTDGCYSFTPTAADGEACDDKKKPCVHYTLTANLESGKAYTKTSLN